MCNIYYTSQHAHEMLVKGDARNFLLTFVHHLCLMEMCS
jgi:hypothetical protein